MSNINLRLYADQVYGISSNFLNEYLSPSIDKESFISMFKDGLIKYQNINTKKEMKIHPTLLINSLLLNSLEVNIPDENSHLIINIDGLKTTLILSEISESDLEQIMISQRKDLKEKFIKDLFYKITKKSDSSSFIEGLIENIVTKIVDGLTIKIKDMEIKLKFENYEFIIKINSFELVIENKELKIDFNDLSIFYNDDISKEETLIHKTDINIKLIINDKEENSNNDKKDESLCELKINTKNLKINLSRKIIKYIFNIINLFRDIIYNEKYLRYKKLIQFHRPKIDNKNYKLLWHYAIKTVIKLRKFACTDNFDIFELLNFTQKKLIKTNNSDNFLLPSDLNVLCSTRNDVEKKVLDSKESLANKFFSFFAAKTEEKTLTEEEKKMIEDAYKEENIEKYLIKGKFEDDNNEKEIIKKIKKYLSCFEININIEKLNIIFNNEKISENNYLNNQNIYLSLFYFRIKLENNIFSFNINANDIGKNENESFGSQKVLLDETNNDSSKNNFIEFSYDNKNNLNFILGNKLIEVSENIVNLTVCYTIYIFQYIFLFNERSIFHKNKENKNIPNVNVKKPMINKINIPFLPSLTIITNDNNKINTNVTDYSFKNNIISFKSNIKDLYSTILEDYQYNILIDEENKRLSVNLEKQLNIKINKEIIENLVINFKNVNNLFFDEDFNINKRLFNFKFTKYINIFNNIIELLNINVNLNIKDFNFLIKDKKIENSFKLNNFDFKCENKHLILNANKIYVNADILSLQPILEEIKKIKLLPNASEYKNIKHLIKEILKSFEFNINLFEAFLYIEHHNFYIESIAEGIEGNNDNIDNHIINYSIKKINANGNIGSETLKIFESQNLKFIGRINSKYDLIFKINIDSPFLSVKHSLYDPQASEILKYFLESEFIYEINITNIKTEVYEEYIRNSDDKVKSDLSINITNYNKNKDNKQIDLINLEKDGLNYNIESFTNIIIKVKGNNLRFLPTQKDVSFLFFSLFRPEKDDSNLFEIINSVSVESNLYQIKIGFHPEVDYDKEIFSIYFGNLFLNLNMNKHGIQNLDFKLNKLEIKYYEENKTDHKIIPISILDDEITQRVKDSSIDVNTQTLLLNEEEKQIEIKKDANNKINININKINVVFRYDIIILMFYYFKDLGVFDLIDYYYKYIESDTFDNYKKDANNIDIQILLTELQLQFPIDYFNQKNNIKIYFNQLDFAYIKIFNNFIKDHRIRISLNSIRIDNFKRKILYTKNDYLLFVLNIKEENSLSVICNSLFNTMIINLSYKDIILLYKLILDIQNLNQTIFGISILSLIKEKNENRTAGYIHYDSAPISENKLKNDNNIEKKNFNFLKMFNSIIAEFNLESICITLLDDYIIGNDNINNSYNPFLNANLFNVKLNYELNRDINERYPNANFNSNYNLLINYYNHLIRKWEPVTEDLVIKLDYILKAEINKVADDYTLEINKLTLNISETFINILLIKLNDWMYKIKMQLYYLIKSMKLKKNKKIKSNNNENGDKMLKYIIYNYTDTDINIGYYNKHYKLNYSKKLDIEYSDEDINEMNNSTSNLISISFNDNKNNKDKIIIFPEDFGIKQFSLQNKEISIYIKTKLNKDKNIDIFIFNPIIFKNKTNYSLDMHLNGKNIETKIINLPPNSSVGMPIDYILNTDTNFQIELNKNNNIDKNPLTDIIGLKDLIINDSNEKICKDILFKNNNISLSLISKEKLKNFRTIIISYKYCIINCLPCSLFISQNPVNNKSKQSDCNNDEKNIEISNNSYYNLDDISFLTESNSIFLRLKVLSGYFYSKLSLKRSETKKKLIKFTNLNNKETLVLPILIKETYKTKVIIIYSEYILYNCSGIDLNISSQDKDNHNYFYNIGNNINLISSEIKDSNANICIKSNKNMFSTNYIEYEQMIKNPLYEFTLNLEDKSKSIKYYFDLLINKNISHLWCENDKENYINKISEDLDLITIYKIIPKYNIINNTRTTNITDNHNNINIILKNGKQYFMGINIKTFEEIKEKSNYYMFDNLSLNSLYTICIKENLYNVEVRKSKNGYKDIFIFNNNLKYSQVVVENRTNFDIYLKQKKYEKYKQEVKKNETQILKIYEQTSQNFSVQIDNKLYYLNFNEIGKKQIVNNLYLNIFKIRNTKKLVFYIYNIKDDLTQKSKSVIDLPKISYNNLKMNFKSNKFIKINIILNHINISIIGGNKTQYINDNNNNKCCYERKEIALLFINDFQCGVILSSKKDILPNNNIYQIKLKIIISNFEIYDLLTSNNNNISCLCINASSPLLDLYSEINYDFDKNRIKFIELINKVGDIRLNIAPVFLQELYNFIKNIIINVKYHNKIVDKIFIMKNKNMDCHITNINNNKYLYKPFSLVIDKFEVSGIKIRFKLKKEGLDTLPKLILDAINYLKCFPFFKIDKETKAILGKISLIGPFKDIKILLNNIKMLIITQLSKELVIKVLHPSANEIKDNINNMIGHDNKILKNSNDEDISRVKNKRIFLGKNKFYKKYSKNEVNIIQKIKDDLEKHKDKHVIDIIEDKNWVIFLFDDCLIYATDSNIKTVMNYKNINSIKNEKNKIVIKYNGEKSEEIVFEFKDEFISKKVYNFLINVSNI